MLSKMLRGSVNNTTNPTVSDPNFKQVSLLLHGDGTNGAQNNTFLDSSTNNFTVTRTGTPTQGTNTPFSQDAGYWSNYFNGTTDIISAPSNAAFNFGTGDFTVECWCYLTSLAIRTRLFAQAGTAGASNTSIVMNVETNGQTVAYVSDGTNFLEANSGSAGTITINAWAHVAMVRDGSTLRLYVNGVQKGTGSLSGVTVPSSTSPFVVGRSGDSASEYTQGYISNMRVVKGTCVYPSGTTFPPSTTPLTAISGTSLLTCQSNNFKDNSSNNFAVTATGTPSVQPFSPFAPTSAYSTSVNGGSMYFDGTGDYLSIADNVALQFGAGDFTIESYINLNSLPAAPYFAFEIVGCWGSGGSYPYLFSVYNNSGTTQLRFLALTGATSIYANANIVINTWNHVAVTRSGTSLKMFLNGIEVTSGATFSSTLPSGPPTIIGSNQGTVNFFDGYQSSTRLVKGTAVYTANFTPPTAPLTAITNTSLLLSGTNAGIYDNAIKNDLETVGSAQVSTSVVKYGTGSMKFNGTTDYLNSPISPQLVFGTGNFTIEGWFYFNSVASGQQPVSGYTAGNNENYAWYMTSTGGLAYYLSSTGNSWNIANNVTMGTVSANTWTHIALVRNGSTFTPYINGVAGTTSSSSSAIYSSGTGITLGAYANAFFFNGYIDDFRITKGIARYTANFTPPTSAFPNS